MSVMSDGMPRMPQRNGEMKDAQTQTDDDLLMIPLPKNKDPVS
jgi:hypothetical protein